MGIRRPLVAGRGCVVGVEVTKPDSEQAQHVAGLLRMYGHADLADELLRRERGEAKEWTKLRVGDTFMCEITVRKGTPAPFHFEDEE